MIVALIMCSLLLATGGGSLSLGNTSDLLDSALDFLSLLSASLALHDVAVLYNTTRSAAPFYIKKDLIDSKCNCLLRASSMVCTEEASEEGDLHV
jgi:hypothetical protein